MNTSLDLIGSIAQIIGSIVAIAGIFYIALQVRDARRSTLSSLISDLHRQANSHSDAILLLSKNWKSDNDLENPSHSPLAPFTHFVKLINRLPYFNTRQF